MSVNTIISKLGKFGVLLSQGFPAEPERFVGLDPIVAQLGKVRIAASERLLAEAECFSHSPRSAASSASLWANSLRRRKASLRNAFKLETSRRIPLIEYMPRCMIENIPSECLGSLLRPS